MPDVLDVHKPSDALGNHQMWWPWEMLRIDRVVRIPAHCNLVKESRVTPDVGEGYLGVVILLILGGRECCFQEPTVSAERIF